MRRLMGDVRGAGPEIIGPDARRVCSCSSSCTGHAVETGGYNPAQYIAPCAGLSRQESRGFMTQISIIVPSGLRVLAVATAALLACASVVADEYSDVNQLIHAGKASEAQAKADQYLAAKPKDPQMRFLKGVI